MTAPAGTRRALLRSSAAMLAGLSAAGVAGCGAKSGPHTHHLLSRRLRRDDVRLLNEVLALEQRTIAAYTATGSLLTGYAQKAAGQFLGQELLHAGELRSMITSLGGTAHNPSEHYEFGQPRGHRPLLELLHGLEQAQLVAYLHVFPLLSAGFVRQGVASILANDAQHVFVLRSELGSPALPAALLTPTE